MDGDYNHQCDTDDMNATTPTSISTSSVDNDTKVELGVWDRIRCQLVEYLLRCEYHVYPWSEYTFVGSCTEYGYRTSVPAFTLLVTGIP